MLRMQRLNALEGASGLTGLQQDAGCIPPAFVGAGCRRGGPGPVLLLLYHRRHRHL